MPFVNEEFMKFKLDELKATDALLLGRVTYEGFAAAWPGRKDEVGFADKFNSMPKYVVSSNLRSVEWNNSHIVKENVVQEIQKLKEKEGGYLAVHGSGTLTRFLLDNGLVDEMNILLYPVVIGTGKKLFEGAEKTILKLKEAKPFKTGITALKYHYMD